MEQVKTEIISVEDAYNRMEDLLKAIIDFYRLMGNDYVSAFFRKEKQACWITFVKDSKFQALLLSLATFCDLPQVIAEVLE